MTNDPDILKSLSLRAVLGLPLTIGGIVMFFVADAVGNAAMKLGLALVAYGMTMMGAVVLARPLARLIAEPFGAIYWPGKRFTRPQPIYGIPESQRAKGLYEEAMAGFERIAEDYPSEVRPYVEMMDMCIVNLKDPRRANAVYQRGVARLEKDEDKEALARMYSAIRTRLNARPSN
jgi:hypothetical protein